MTEYFRSSLSICAELETGIDSEKMAKQYVEAELREWGQILTNASEPLVLRYRALHALKHATDPLSVKLIEAALADKSDMFKHDLCYVLGQKKDPSIVPSLIKVLEDEQEAIIVRHEAAASLATLGAQDTKWVLNKYLSSPAQELSETCHLALRCLEWMSHPEKNILMTPNIHKVEIAPALPDQPVEELQKMLCDTRRDLFDRYRAIFTLRNKAANARNDKQVKEAAIFALATGLKCKDSALLRHDVALAVGDLADLCSFPFLSTCLQDLREHSIVRHEVVDAIRKIGNEEGKQLLKKYLNDDELLVKESCVVALGIVDYINSDLNVFPSVPPGNGDDNH